MVRFMTRDPIRRAESKPHEKTKFSIIVWCSLCSSTEITTISPKIDDLQSNRSESYLRSKFVSTAMLYSPLVMLPYQQKYFSFLFIF